MGDRGESPGDLVIARPLESSRPVQWLLFGTTGAVLMLYGAGWIAAATVLWEQASFRAPRIQSAILLSLALIVLRAASASRRQRRQVILIALVLAAVAFFLAPLPKQFGDESIMPGGSDTARSRSNFEQRFAVSEGDVHFHSHLGDVAMTALDGVFGRSESSPARAYDALSRLAGLLFLFELAVAAAWHRWSRQICRYVGLALAAPLCLLFFGYWDLGYLCIAVGVVPLLALGRQRISTGGDAATLTAGFLQGLHTALHGFGLLGLAGGALAAFSTRGGILRRIVRAVTFVSAGVALYLGWVFFYIAVGRLSVIWERQLGYRPLSEPMVFDHLLANPLLSRIGLAEFGLFGALSGVPILALALVSGRRAALVPAVLYALPGLLFQVRWWPPSAPFNLDLLLAVFPGLFAACWVIASSRRTSMRALVLLSALHVLVWMTVGNGLFARINVDS
jgi:hypothetical protein